MSKQHYTVNKFEKVRFIQRNRRFPVWPTLYSAITRG